MHHVSPASVAEDHAVQIYEDEGELCACVADYLVEALSTGEPVVVIATPDRRTRITEQLTQRDIDVRLRVATGSITWVDAREMLASFMVGDHPDRARFEMAFDDVVERARAYRGASTP